MFLVQISAHWKGEGTKAFFLSNKSILLLTCLLCIFKFLTPCAQLSNWEIVAVNTAIMGFKTPVKDFLWLWDPTNKYPCGLSHCMCQPSITRKCPRGRLPDRSGLREVMTVFTSFRSLTFDRLYFYCYQFWTRFNELWPITSQSTMCFPTPTTRAGFLPNSLGGPKINTRV